MVTWYGLRFVQTGAKFPKLLQVSGENDDQICNGMGFVIGRQTQMSCSEFRNHHEMGLSENRLAPNQLVNVSLSFPIEIAILLVYHDFESDSSNICWFQKSHELPPNNIPMLFPHITF